MIDRRERWEMAGMKLKMEMEMEMEMMKKKLEQGGRNEGQEEE